MQIHILDLQDFDQMIETESDICIRDLLNQISEKYQYDTSTCNIYHFGQKLDPSFHLTPEFLKDNNILVLLNQLIVKEKSYPKVDNAFRFQTSRFKKYYSELRTTGQICPKLDSVKMNSQSFDQDSFENSIYNNFQTQLNPELAILPQQEPAQTDSQGSYEFFRNNQAFDPESLNRYTPEQVQSLYRLFETGHNPYLILHFFDMANQNEERCLSLLSSLSLPQDFDD